MELFKVAVGMIAAGQNEVTVKQRAGLFEDALYVLVGQPWFGLGRMCHDLVLRWV
jgi:hypothetical protein